MWFIVLHNLGHRCPCTNQIYPVIGQANATVAGSYFLFLLKCFPAVERENSVEREFFQAPGFVGRVMFFQHSGKMVIGRG